MARCVQSIAINNIHYYVMLYCEETIGLAIHLKTSDLESARLGKVVQVIVVSDFEAGSYSCGCQMPTNRQLGHLRLALQVAGISFEILIRRRGCD